MFICEDSLPVPATYIYIYIYIIMTYMIKGNSVLKLNKARRDWLSLSEGEPQGSLCSPFVCNVFLLLL